MSAALEQRLQRVEDERAVADVLARYGWCADVGDHDGFIDLFADDAVIELIGGVPSGAKSDPAVWQGKAEIRAFIDDPEMHMKIEGRCMHLPALNLRIAIDGDTATADSNSVVLLSGGEGIDVYGAGFTRWVLTRAGADWLISRRSRVAIGATERMAAWA